MIAVFKPMQQPMQHLVLWHRVRCPQNRLLMRMMSDTSSKGQEIRAYVPQIAVMPYGIFCINQLLEFSC